MYPNLVCTLLASEDASLRPLTLTKWTLLWMSILIMTSVIRPRLRLRLRSECLAISKNCNFIIVLGTHES